MLEVAELQGIGRYNLEDRKTYASVLKTLLANNLGSEEIEYVPNGICALT